MTRFGAWAPIAAAVCLTLPATAADWRLERLRAVGPVKAIEKINGEPHIAIGGGWFRLIARTYGISFVATARPLQSTLPEGALPDGRVAVGKREIARTWLAEPTRRYGHGVLGDAVEAATVVVQRIDGRRDTIQLSSDAVFEDLEPRIAAFAGSVGEKVIVVKSHLRHGSSLAVIGQLEDRFRIVAETPPIGAPNRWLNPAGIADFNGDGATDVALVRMPHALGQLELWSWRNNELHKSLELGDTSNHVIGSRVLGMSAVADFDGDGSPDLAIPSFDRRAIRIIAFAPTPRDVARVELPAPAVTEVAAIRDENGHWSAIVGLEGGALVIARRTPPPRH